MKRFALVGVVTVVLSAVFAGSASAAQIHGSQRNRAHDRGSVYRYSPHSRHYSAPARHIDYRYHPDYGHWTPWRGFHSHGHYDAVPHYSRQHSHR